MDVKPTTDQFIDTRDEQFPGEQSKSDTILAEARSRINLGWTYWQDNYTDSDQDRQFAAGYQWPEDIVKDRTVDNRPMLTVNKLPQFINRVVNDMKQNRTQIKVRPAEANATGKEPKIKNVAGDKDYDLSEVYAAIISNIEYNSSAIDHYDRASEQMVQGAIAWLRVYTAYSTNDAFDVDLKIGSVRNPTAAMIDPMACEPDWSDSKWGCVFEKVKKAEFEKRWPDARPGELNQANDWQFDFGNDEYITVCEYMTLEADTFMLFQMSDGQVWDGRDVGDGAQKTASGDWFIDNDENLSVINARKVNGWKVVWRKITAWDILEGGEKGIEMPFSTIPLLPVFGKEVVLPDRRNFESLIRHALDSQREFNYWRTAMVEMVALQPKQPYVGTAVNFENDEDAWATANTKNHAYLTYTPDPENGGAAPIRQPMAQAPAAEMNNAMAADESMKASMGMYDASLGNVSKEESGRAILARERQSDIGTYHFTDSRDKAIARVGKLLLEAIPDVYPDDRMVRLRFEDETEDFVRINHQITDINGTPITVNDIGIRKYDVRVVSGPSYNTQRVEAVNTLIEFIQAVPNAGAAAQDIIARNMDFPGAEELADRLARAVPPNLLDPEDAEEMPQPPPDPNLVLQQQIEQAKNEGRQLDLQEEALKNEGKALDIQKAQAEAAAFDPAKLEDMVINAIAAIEAGKMREGIPPQQ